MTSNRKPRSPRADTRRTFLRRTAAAVLLAGAPSGWIGRVFADDSPETPECRCGIIALTDCSPFVIAAEKGFFQRHGLKVTIAKGANWAAIRDALANGDNQFTHMLFGMPFASSMGLAGSPKKPLVIPWLLNRNGQAITVRADWKGVVGESAAPLKALAAAAKAKGEPLSFAMTFPPGTHAIWLRFWLGAGGVHPDRDVSLITIPPPQMVSNMRAGKMDGFCVGEPWNARAIADHIGFTAVTSQQIWRDHPEKVCAFTAEFAEKNPKTVKAVLKALHEASVWLDQMENRRELASIVHLPNYINCPEDLILARLMGDYDYGDGRRRKDPDYMIFSSRNCNYPQAKYGLWWLSQFRRWGMVRGAPDYQGVVRQVLRPDLYEAAMKEIGHAHGGASDAPETLIDGRTFDPGRPEEYATGFAVHSLAG